MTNEDTINTQLLSRITCEDIENNSHDHPVVSYSTKKSDRCPIGGTVCLLFYIGTWIISSISPFLVLLLLFFNYITAGLLLAFLLIVCLVIPLSPITNLRRYFRYYFSRFFTEASIRFEHIPQVEKDRPTILCVNPHGIFSLIWAYCYLADEFEHFHWCFSSLLRLSPIFRILTDTTGHASNIRKNTVVDHMIHKRSIAIIPGGWHEGTLHTQTKDRLYIRKRQGFIKYALQYGYTITPSYGFGERTTYWNISGAYNFRFRLNDYGILTVLPFGQWWCPILPYSEKLHVVIGSPIQLPHIQNPTPENVNYWHSVYINEMVNLYNRYKYIFYGQEAENMQLEIW
jgi:hypothetical protein